MMTLTKRKKNSANDEYFANMNSYHKNIKLTVESNPSRFLDTAFSVNPDGSMTAKVFWKSGKFPAFFGTHKCLKITKGMIDIVTYIEP